MKKNESKLSKLHGNLVGFTEDFIIAGPRNNLLAFFRKLEELGAQMNISERYSSSQVSGYKHVVLLCINYIVSSQKSVPEVRLLTRDWWNYYHNPKYRSSPDPIKTYNAMAQQEQIIEKLIIRPIPEVIPESVN